MRCSLAVDTYGGAGSRWSAWVTSLAAVALVAGIVLATSVRGRPRAHQLAEDELRRRLASSEFVLAEVRASQDHWYDLYRTTDGVLAATDRRVIFVGVVPEAYASVERSQLFDVRSFAYDTGFTITRVRAPLGAPRVRVTGGGRDEEFGVSADVAAALDALVAAARGRVLTLRQSLDDTVRSRGGEVYLMPTDTTAVPREAGQHSVRQPP